MILFSLRMQNIRTKDREVVHDIFINIYCIASSNLLWHYSWSKHLYGESTGLNTSVQASRLIQIHKVLVYIRNQFHALRSLCHMLVDSRSIGEWMMRVGSVIPGKCAQRWRKPCIQDQKMTCVCEHVKCHDANYGEKVHAQEQTLACIYIYSSIQWK